MSSGPVDGLRRLRVSRSDRSDLAWSEGLQVNIPQSALAATGLDRCIDSDGNLTIPAALPPVDAGAAETLRLRRAFTPEPPASARMPVSYRRVPGPLRRAIGDAIGRWQRRRESEWAAFPGWPLDLSSDLLTDLSRPGTAALSRTPVLLTHDIDSPDGLRNLVQRFLPIEETVGARSTNYIVPCAWELDQGLLAEVHRRGHELGVHGFDHANRTPFVSTAERRQRLLAAVPLAERFGMRGYRAPSLLRTRELLADLAEFYTYDSSIPTSGGPFPVPNNGCASARPFRVGGLLEIPVSMPRDGSLRFLGFRADAICDTWKACATRIARSGGVVVLLTHCEDHFSGNAEMLETYRTFLTWIAADARFVWSRSEDLAASLQHD